MAVRFHVVLSVSNASCRVSEYCLTKGRVSERTSKPIQYEVKIMYTDKKLMVCSGIEPRKFHFTVRLFYVKHSLSTEFLANNQPPVRIRYLKTRSFIERNYKQFEAFVACNYVGLILITTRIQRTTYFAIDKSTKKVL